jgi:hypothetical protein
MLLKSEDGKEFELALIADRLPDPQDGFGDSTDATISVRVATNEEEWEETAPCLNLYEIHTLADWLDAVAGGGSGGGGGDGEVDILESDLNFKVVKDHGDWVVIRVRFKLEDRPQEYSVDAETTEASHVDLKLRRSLLRGAVVQLRSDLRDFELPAKDDLSGDEEVMAESDDADGQMSRMEARPEAEEEEEP